MVLKPTLKVALADNRFSISENFAGVSVSNEFAIGEEEFELLVRANGQKAKVRIVILNQLIMTACSHDSNYNNRLKTYLFCSFSAIKKVGNFEVSKFEIKFDFNSKHKIFQHLKVISHWDLNLQHQGCQSNTLPTGLIRHGF